METARSVLSSTADSLGVIGPWSVVLVRELLVQLQKVRTSHPAQQACLPAERDFSHSRSSSCAIPGKQTHKVWCMSGQCTFVSSTSGKWNTCRTWSGTPEIHTKGGLGFTCHHGSTQEDIFSSKSMEKRPPRKQERCSKSDASRVLVKVLRASDGGDDRSRMLFPRKTVQRVALLQEREVGSTAG